MIQRWNFWSSEWFSFSANIFTTTCHIFWKLRYVKTFFSLSITCHRGRRKICLHLAAFFFVMKSSFCTMLCPWRYSNDFRHMTYRSNWWALIYLMMHRSTLYSLAVWWKNKLLQTIKTPVVWQYDDENRNVSDIQENGTSKWSFLTPFQSENKEVLLDNSPRLVEDLYTVFGVCIATWLLKF